MSALGGGVGCQHLEQFAGLHITHSIVQSSMTVSGGTSALGVEFVLCG